jgi:hypothetical protein
MNKRTNNDPQITTQKTKNVAAQTPLTIEGELVCSGGLVVPAPPVTGLLYFYECEKYKKYNA